MQVIYDISDILFYLGEWETVGSQRRLNSAASEPGMGRLLPSCPLSVNQALPSL